ncbi:hypothetical protein [Cryobacterium luteum]|uniref:Uncharacterized protein n=1 Tax=Cryobacterium luteum TaxID=1424661 RepID=A0A1H8KF52_9MICO|nr:hypothetical protein [Cryobacterium luteum]TFB89964.1 hypothetical protein E3O10_07540 [Cryobacterium luteum]SEN91602.1 hypothetical protein SAMN05216281_11916 [Cryobacterium luteum]
MGSVTKQPREPHAQRSVPAHSLAQVEPDHAGEFIPRPFSLTSAELGGLTATLANEPTHVRAWVRYPAIAEHVQALALAWTPRAVYVEWEDGGIHRAWIWAPAVERAAPSQSAATPTPPRQHEKVVTVRDTRPLVELVNAQLAQIGAEFVTAMAQPAGPFAAIVFGTIEDHGVRLEFFTAPLTSACAVHLFDMTAKKILTEWVTTPTFATAIETYPWDLAINTLFSREPNEDG